MLIFYTELFISLCLNDWQLLHAVDEKLCALVATTGHLIEYSNNNQQLALPRTWEVEVRPETLDI